MPCLLQFMGYYSGAITRPGLNVAIRIPVLLDNSCTKLCFSIRTRTGGGRERADLWPHTSLVHRDRLAPHRLYRYTVHLTAWSTNVTSTLAVYSRDCVNLTGTPRPPRST
ncbi:hypothetical protein J6590_012959 [Homalodisca vitripennis]|nr:hypothetical protein J6590_012959 [Homalodisca vitripennis]